MKKMRPYTESCKPQEPGWYWAAYRTYEPKPMYFDGVAWYESDCRYEMLSDPNLWLEMDPSSDRIEATVLSPRKMKPYTEDCKPTAPGWYWVGYIYGPTAEPLYYGGDGWFESYNRLIRYVTPHFWLEMDPPSVPEGEA